MMRDLVGALAFLLVLVIANINSSAFAEEDKLFRLRDEIAAKVYNDLYDANEIYRTSPNDTIVIVLPPVDFDSNRTNVTNPYDAWKTLPSWIQYLFGSLIALVGLVITFYGAKLLPLSVFLLGGFTLAVFMYGILAAAVANTDPNKAAIVYGTSAAVWVVGGILMACCISLAVFILGFALGAIVALVLNPIVLKYAIPNDPLGNAIMWVIIFGLVGGAIAYFVRKPILIIATSSGGAFAVVTSIMAMAGSLHLLECCAEPTTWQEWTAFGGFIGLSILGIITQLCCVTDEGFRKLN